VEFKFSNFLVLLSFGATSKLLLMLYFGHCFRNSKFHSKTAQFGAASKLSMAFYIVHGLIVLTAQKAEHF
jgi:hypothetical protein